MYVRVVLACCFAALIHLSTVASQVLASADDAYLKELVERAQVARLAEQREWHVLLHYQPNLLRSGVTSMQDDPGFFMAPNGKTDPQAELAATLAGFFSDELVGRSKQPAQCAFVARYHWLKERLHFDERRLPPQPCERFTRWFNEFNAQSISVIFPTGFMNNPASMFGHTFLRIDGKGQTPQTRILDYTINYAAEVPPNAGPEYAIKGIFGGYRGHFSTIPYYLKVQEYRDIENRDIWEYRLDLTQEQVRRLLMHTWEMGNAYFDYFFFDENCSFHILGLVEAAEPSIHLLDRFPIAAIPVDTVRLLAESGLVADVVARPSRSTLVRRKREAMNAEERRWLNRLVAEPDALKSEDFGTLTPERQAFVLETASDYLLMRGSGSADEGAPFRERNKSILAARSRLKVLPTNVPIDPYVKRPDLGHGTSRVGVGAGWRNNRAFEEINVRAAYHDLLDPEYGYTPDAQIELMSLAVRHYHNESQARVERFIPLDMISLAPMDSLFQAPSWKLGLGMNTIHFGGCQLCTNGYFNGGLGGAVESHVLGRQVWYAMGEVEADASQAYEGSYRAGGGGTVGLLADITDRWKLFASGTYLKFGLGDKSEDIRWFIGQRYTITTNLAFRVEYNHRIHDNDVLGTLQMYF
jgi:Domain of unknown function (DUF4105)